MSRSISWLCVAVLLSGFGSILAPSATAQQRVQVLNYLLDAQQTEGLVAAPALGEHELVSLNGPGLFIAARLTKSLGATGMTTVVLEIDGRTLVQRNIVGLKNLALTQMNGFGLMVLTSGANDTVTIGYPFSLAFRNSLILKAIVNETGVGQIAGTVLHAR